MTISPDLGKPYLYEQESVDRFIISHYSHIRQGKKKTESGVFAMLNRKICFVGAGAMAEALIGGLIAQGKVTPEKIAVVNKTNLARLEDLAAKYGVQVGPEKKGELIRQADILILAVKPKDVKTVLEEIRPLIHERQLVISVVAGLPISAISKLLGKEVKVIRTMPNTSALVGLSATALSIGSRVDEKDLDVARAIFQSVGEVYLVKEEEMDIITGLAGSGPAYVYYLVEAMIKGGIDGGLDENLAYKLALQTVLGAAKMLTKTGENPALLRQKVTSPNGTTARGIATLEKYHFEEAVRQCILEAAKRSKELSKEWES